MIFEWVTPIIRLGYKRPLKIADVWTLNSIYTTDYILAQFNKRWEKRPKDEPGRLVQLRRNVAFIIFLVLWPHFSLVFVLKTIQTCFMFLSPIVLDWLIFFMASNDPNWIGYLYASMLFLISFLESMFESQYEFNLGVLQMKVKTCLMSTVYKKALVLSTDGRKEFSTGQISRSFDFFVCSKPNSIFNPSVNMMSVDVQALVDYVNFSRFR